MTYPIYSDNVWDYLQDMPYMPSCSDRDYIKLKQDVNKRMKIWEYFFRIKSDDVGKPQKDEIQSIEQMLKKEIKKFDNQVYSDKNYIKTLNKRTWVNYIKYAIGVIIINILWKLTFQDFQSEFNPTSNFYVDLKCSSPFLILNFVMTICIAVTKLKQLFITRRTMEDQYEMRSLLGMKISEGRQRINDLNCQIDALKRQIPEPYLDSIIKKWLDEELFELWQFSKEKTGLGTRLVPIGFYETTDISKSVGNPLSIMGPGELQDPKNMHPIFKRDLSTDFNKHLTARRAYKAQTSGKKDVIYGVYYIEYIAIADDMLATYGFFYDFITRERYSEKVTEQYYKDVVSISAANEYREIRLNDSDEKILIEDAPTLTLSLSSGEERKVTFVNNTYFWRIKEKLDMTDDEARNIDLVQVSDEMAENATKALRYHLRKHKGSLEQELN